MKQYFTKKHIRALLGLLIVALVFWLYSVALLSTSPGSDNSESFEPLIEQQEPVFELDIVDENLEREDLE